MSSITDDFIDSLYDLADNQLPIRQAKKCILDFLGVTFAGSKMLQEKGETLLNILDEGNNGNVSPIGFKRNTSLQNAALLNGMSGHIAELDDGVRFGNIHPGVPVLSVLLPLAQKENLNSDQLLIGTITGYEAAIKLSIAIQPAHKMRGFHATGTCGTIGAAIGIAAALDLSRGQMKNALSAAVTSASGILKVSRDNSELKPYNAAQASLNGLISSSLGRAGFKGPDDILSGDKGFIPMVADSFDYDKLLESDSKYGIEKVYFKPYAACRHSHPAIEAVLNIKANHDVNINDVKSIEVTTYQHAVDGHEHTDITGITSAKMSTPFSVATAFATGKAGINEFSQKYIKDPTIVRLTKKVSVQGVEELSKLVPQKRAAIVEIFTNDGQQYRKRVDLPKGEPENPMSKDEIESKFTALSRYSGKSKKECEQIINYVWDIEHRSDKLYDLL